ncbi:MAG: T9SS type A sorting domain-containing protein [Bacteroidota bacterium]
MDISGLRANGAQVFMPTIACNENGVVAMSWYELDANDNGNYYTSESFDGGMTWEQPLQLSAVPTDFAPYGFQTFFGDYAVTVRTGCSTYSSWSDGRNNNGPKLYIAKTTKCGPVAVQLPEITPLTSDIQLKALYPNPTQDVVRMDLALTADTPAEIRLLDVQGKVVQALYKGELSQGTHTLEYTLNGVSSGAYLIHIETELGMLTRQLIVE